RARHCGPWGRASPSRRWPGCRRRAASFRARRRQNVRLWQPFQVTPLVDRLARLRLGSLSGLTRQSIVLRRGWMPASSPGMTVERALEPHSHSPTSGDHAHDVGFLHDQEVLAVELDFGAGPFAEQHPVAGLDVGLDDLAGLVAAAGPDRNDFTLRRLLLGGAGCAV